MDNRASRSSLPPENLQPHKPKHQSAQECLPRLVGPAPGRPEERSYTVELGRTTRNTLTLRIDTLNCRRGGCRHIKEEVSEETWQRIGRLLAEVGVLKWRSGLSSATIPRVPVGIAWELGLQLAAALHMA